MQKQSVPGHLMFWTLVNVTVLRKCLDMGENVHLLRVSTISDNLRAHIKDGIGRLMYNSGSIIVRTVRNVHRITGNSWSTIISKYGQDRMHGRWAPQGGGGGSKTHAFHNLQLLVCHVSNAGGEYACI